MMMVVVVTTTPFACPSSSFIQTLITPSSSAAALFRHEFNSIFSQKSTTIQKKFLSPSIQSLLLHCSSSAGGESSSSSSLTEIGQLFLFFQQIGIQEKETQILIDKNPNLLLVSIELLRGRVRSLGSIGIHGFSLSSLLTKRIEILTSEEIGPLLCFIKDDLEGGEMNPKKLLRLLSTTEPRFLVGFVEKVGLLLDHGIPQDKLVHILNNVNLNKVFCHRSVEEIHKTILFLIRVGGVELIVKRPALLNFDLESQLIPRANLFIELSGEDESAVGIVLRKLPAILTYSVEHMQRQVECLRSLVGLSDEEIFRIVKVYPNICSVSRERKLKPRIEFLIQCGLNRYDIYKFLTRAPLFMSLSFKGNLSKKIGILIKLGYKNRKKDFAIALGAVTRISSENMQNMIGVFLSYGFSYEDIFAMTKKHPNILQYSPKSLEKKMEYLVEDMGRDIRELLDFPAFLGYKLDGRIKHRHEVRKEMIGEGMSINQLLNVSTENFLEKTSLSSTNIEHSSTGGQLDIRMMMNAIRKTMKRINRISRKLSLLNSPPVSNNININSIPHDMLTEIIARVASSSAADLYNVKITCKDFNKAGDDKHVYRYVSMEDFQVVPWKPSEAVSSFLKRCEENENPEALYRRGMVKYFSHDQLEDGRILLHKAANLGHTAATYVLGIILLEDHDQSIRDQGMKLLSKITLGSKHRSRIIRDCRKKSEKILHQIWINDDSSIHPQERHVCDCNERFQKRGGWSSSDEECEEIFDCEACKWKHEVTCFYNMLKGN